MKILFVRHASAVNPLEFNGNDAGRPLTEEGVHKARRLFNMLARFYEPPELMVSSNAVRARQTADLLAEVFPRATRRLAPEFNPGANHRVLVRWLRGSERKLERVAVVGHEPDISRMIADTVAHGVLNLEVKKAACIEVDCNRLGRGELTLLLPPWAAGKSDG